MASIVDFVYIQLRNYAITTPVSIGRIFNHIKMIHRQLKNGWNINSSMSHLDNYERSLVRCIEREFLERRMGSEFQQTKLGSLLPREVSLEVLRRAGINSVSDVVYDTNSRVLERTEIVEKIHRFDLDTYHIS